MDFHHTSYDGFPSLLLLQHVQGSLRSLDHVRSELPRITKKYTMPSWEQHIPLHKNHFFMAICWKFSEKLLILESKNTHLDFPCWESGSKDWCPVNLSTRCSSCTILQMSASLDEKLKSVRSKENILLDQRRDPYRDRGGSCYEWWKTSKIASDGYPCTL